MPLPDLLNALEAEAAADAERVRRDTEAEAAAIIESAEREAGALELRAARAAEADLARELERYRSEARLAATAVVRGAHETSYEMLLAALRRRLDAFRETRDYPALLRALVEESVAALPDASIVRIDPRDEQIVSAVLLELGVTLEMTRELSTAGGIEVATSDGRSVRNTIEERLHNAEPALRLLAGRLLDQDASVRRPMRVAKRA